MAAALFRIFLLPPSADKFVPWKWTLVAWPVSAKSFSGWGLLKGVDPSQAYPLQFHKQEGILEPSALAMAQFSPLLPQAACHDWQCQLSQIPGHTQLGVQSPHSSPSPGPQASGIQPGAPGSGGGPGKRSGWGRTLGTGVCACACVFVGTTA